LANLKRPISMLKRQMELLQQWLYSVELRVNGKGGVSVVIVLCDGNIVAVDTVRKKTNTDARTLFTLIYIS